MDRDKTNKPVGRLFIVATPIGNLDDISIRALKSLKEAGLIAAEDTRKTRKLLSAFDIHTPLISLYDKVERGKSGIIISRILSGTDVAYVCDAGTPGISRSGLSACECCNSSLNSGYTCPGAFRSNSRPEHIGSTHEHFQVFGISPIPAFQTRQIFFVAQG